ncbi:hypothetical protein BC832DRAFT_363447 [Gaertneriomyces semiglobifer]|nr:hypothetical protein BC832DRAFT_363447 [Gaertneriomyces semiglobifer]
MSSTEFRIRIMDPSQPERIFFSFTTPQQGRPLLEILVFLDVVTAGSFRIGHTAYLVHLRHDIIIDMTADGQVNVVPGTYELKGDPLPMLEKHAPTPRLFPSTPASSHPGSRPGTPTSVTAAKEILSREANFRDRVVQRDRWCIVTGETEVADCVAAHVIPYAWKKNNVIGLLPEDVRLHILELPLDIDSVDNGFFLRKDLHDDFDGGKWAVKVGDDGIPRFFGLSAKYRQSEYHGRALHLPSGTSPSGVDMKSFFPNKLLWDHHFKCAVFGMMKAKAGDTEAQDDRDDEENIGITLTVDDANELEFLDAFGAELFGTLALVSRQSKADILKAADAGRSQSGLPTVPSVLSV